MCQIVSPSRNLWQGQGCVPLFCSTCWHLLVSMLLLTLNSHILVSAPHLISTSHSYQTMSKDNWVRPCCLKQATGSAAGHHQVCVCVYARVCCTMCKHVLSSEQDIGSPEFRVTRSCEPPSVMRKKHWFSERAARTPHHWAIQALKLARLLKLFQVNNSII